MTEDQRNSCISMRAIGTRIINPCQQNLAFNEWVIPVLINQIQHPDPCFRKRALKTLLDTVYDPCKLANKDFQHIIAPLINLSTDADVGVRLLLIQCFAVISMSAVGRNIIIDNDLIGVTENLLHDTDSRIRKTANITLRRVTLTPMSLPKLEVVVPTLLTRLPLEDDDTKGVVLTTLHAICTSSSNRDYLIGTTEMLVMLLKSECPEVRQGACAVLMDSCLTDEGKHAAIDEGAVPILMKLCHDICPEVVAKALGALMVIVTCTLGKKACCDIRNIKMLMSLLESKHVEIRLNCICVLTPLAEHTPAFKYIASHRWIFHELSRDPTNEVQLAAKTILLALKKRVHRTAYE